MKLLIDPRYDYIFFHSQVKKMLTWQTCMSTTFIMNHVKYCVYRTPLNIILNHSTLIAGWFPDDIDPQVYQTFKENHPRLSIERSI